MYTQSLYLKTHLDTGKTAGAFNPKNIKLYSGELQDADKLKDQVPAIYITPMEGTPAAEIPSVQIDLIVVTKSDTFDKQNNAIANMQLTEQICTYLQNNQTIGSGTWTIDTETINSKVLALDNKFAIVRIQLNLNNVK